MESFTASRGQVLGIRSRFNTFELSSNLALTFLQFYETFIFENIFLILGFKAP